MSVISHISGAIAERGVERSLTPFKDPHPMPHSFHELKNPDPANAILVIAGLHPSRYVYLGTDSQKHFFENRGTGQVLLLPINHQFVQDRRFAANQRTQGANRMEQCRRCSTTFTVPYTNCPECGVRLRKKKVKVEGLHPDTMWAIRRAIVEIAEDTYHPVREVIVPRSEMEFAQQYAHQQANSEDFVVGLSVSRHNFRGYLKLRIARSLVDKNSRIKGEFTVPHSELAMHMQIAGMKATAIAKQSNDNYVIIEVAGRRYDGLPQELIPVDIRKDTLKKLKAWKDNTEFYAYYQNT